MFSAWFNWKFERILWSKRYHFWYGIYILTFEICLFCLNTFTARFCVCLYVWITSLFAALGVFSSFVFIFYLVCSSLRSSRCSQGYKIVPFFVRFRNKRQIQSTYVFRFFDSFSSCILFHYCLVIRFINFVSIRLNQNDIYYRFVFIAFKIEFGLLTLSLFLFFWLFSLTSSVFYCT